jgi:hypothetical protein
VRPWPAVTQTARRVPSGRESICLGQRFLDHAPLTIDDDFTL